MLFTIYMPLSLYQYANKTESFPRKENQISLQLAAQLEMILLFFFSLYIYDEILSYLFFTEQDSFLLYLYIY